MTENVANIERLISILEELYAEGEGPMSTNVAEVTDFLEGMLDSSEVRKIVVNKCYGGYSLSDACHVELMKRGHELSLREQQEEDEAYVDEPKWSALSWKDSWGRDIPRDDVMLIEVLESLGVESCSGAHASLHVTEVPSNVEWWIHEYDGSEHVEEAHRSW